MTGLDEELKWFFGSDLVLLWRGWGTGVLQPFLSNTCAHIALGGACGILFWHFDVGIKWVRLFFLVVVLKDISDLAFERAAVLSIADLFWDFGSYYFGFMAVLISTRRFTEHG